MGNDVPHMPDSRPTLKQLESLLKDAERTAVGAELSIGPRTFILAVSLLRHVLGNGVTVVVDSDSDDVCKLLKVCG